MSGSAVRTEEPPAVDFSDTAEAYKSRSTRELLRSYLVFKVLQYDIFVNNSYKVLAVTLLLHSLRQKVCIDTL